MRPSSVVSRLCSSASRTSKTRLQFCVDLKSVTKCITGCASKTRPLSPPLHSRIVTSPIASCPTKQSISSTKRRPPCASRSIPCQPRSTSSSGEPHNWKTEKDIIARSRELKEKIEQLKLEEQTEERKGNLARVAEIRYGLLRQTEEELKKVTAQMDGNVVGGRTT